MIKTKRTAPKPSGEVVFYKTVDGGPAVDVRLELETVWLTQKQMSDLFDTERSVITKHLRNVFKIRELDKDSVCAFFAHTAADGKTYDTQYYNLDAILSVVIYVAMGWAALVALVPLVHALGPAGFAWVAAGGLFYTIGIVFYALDTRLIHAHGVWHLFVIGGSAAHYVAILLYVL